jgi:hypothetical protein
MEKITTRERWRRHVQKITAVSKVDDRQWSKWRRHIRCHVNTAGGGERWDLENKNFVSDYYDINCILNFWKNKSPVFYCCETTLFVNQRPVGPWIRNNEISDLDNNFQCKTDGKHSEFVLFKISTRFVSLLFSWYHADELQAIVQSFSVILITLRNAVIIVQTAGHYFVVNRKILQFLAKKKRQVFVLTHYVL